MNNLNSEVSIMKRTFLFLFLVCTFIAGCYYAKSIKYQDASDAIILLYLWLCFNGVLLAFFPFAPIWIKESHMTEENQQKLQENCPKCGGEGTIVSIDEYEETENTFSSAQGSTRTYTIETRRCVVCNRIWTV